MPNVNSRKQTKTDSVHNDKTHISLSLIVAIVIAVIFLTGIIVAIVMQCQSLERERKAAEEFERREASGEIIVDGLTHGGLSFGDSVRPKCTITNKNIKANLHPESEISSDMSGQGVYPKYGAITCSLAFTGSYTTEAEDTTLYIVSPNNSFNNGIKLEELDDNKFRITTTFNLLANGTRIPSEKKITLGLKNNRTGSNNVTQALNLYTYLSEDDEQFLESWKAKIDAFEKAEQERKKREEELRKERELKSGPPRTGMTQNEVLKTAWGSPKSVNNYNSSWGNSAYWWYGGNRAVWFMDGKVTMVSY